MRYIDADKVMDEINRIGGHNLCEWETIGVKALIDRQPTADVVEVEKVAEMLRLIFIDDCACNYNGNDEWLPMVCKYAETDCPMPKERLGCWKEFVKHFIAKMDGERKE